MPRPPLPETVPLPGDPLVRLDAAPIAYLLARAKLTKSRLSVDLHLPSTVLSHYLGGRPIRRSIASRIAASLGCVDVEQILVADSPKQAVSR